MNISAHFVWLNVSFSACVYNWWTCLLPAAPFQAEQTHLSAFSLMITIFHQVLFRYLRSRETCEEEIPGSNLIGPDIWLKAAWTPIRDSNCQCAMDLCSSKFGLLFLDWRVKWPWTEIIGCVWSTCISWSTNVTARIHRQKDDVVKSIFGGFCPTWRKDVISNNMSKCQTYWMYKVTVMTNRKPIWLSIHVHRFWHHRQSSSKRRAKTRRKERTAWYFGWGCRMHREKQWLIKPIPMTCHDNRVFPLMSSMPSGLFTASMKFNLNQIKQGKPCVAYLWGLALTLYLQVILLHLMKGENDRCAERLSQSGNTMKDNCRAVTARCRDSILSHCCWWYWFWGWLISGVTSSQGCFLRNHREVERCGNNRHPEPIQSQIC